MVPMLASLLLGVFVRMCMGVIVLDEKRNYDSCHTN